MSDLGIHRPSTLAVLDAIRVAGSASRVEVAGTTGLTQATVSNAVRELLDQGLVVETGERTKTRGKPRTLLRLDPRARCAIGVQLSSDSVSVVAIDTFGSVLAKTRLPRVARLEPEHTVPRIAAAIDALITTTGLDRERFVGLGVAAPGVHDLTGGIIRESRALPQWIGLDVRDMIEKRTGFVTILENDATAAAVGDFWGGSLPGARAHCTVQMGTSIGAGFLIDGAPYRGASGNTGPLGILPVRDGKTLEELAAPPAVARDAHQALAAGEPSTISLPEAGTDFDAFQAIARAAVYGDELARTLIEGSARQLAETVVMIASVWDLDSITLAGPAFTIAGTTYLRSLAAHVETHFAARAEHGIRLRLSPQAIDAAAVGAAALTLQEDLTPRR